MSMKTPWDERYATEEYLYGTEPNDFLRSMRDRLPGGEALCVAEGEGRNAVWLAENGYRVTAVDASAIGLEKAKKLAASRGVEIVAEVADLGEYCLAPESVDLVVSIFAHVAPEVRIRLHRNIIEALRPGGIMLLEAYTPKQLEYTTGGPPDLEKLMTLKALHEELSGLDFEHALETEREIIEGKLHTGSGAVVQVLARKPYRST